MSYRDWEGGEGSPHERRPTAAWDGPAEPRPADAHPPERYRTPSRRRARERGQQEPVDPYLPWWALESGVRRADGGGRHAAPDDDDEVPPPYSGGGWRADTGGRGESDRRDLHGVGAGPAGEHTAEWTLDTPQKQGYVGRRRAEPTGVEPAREGWPRRAQPRRPQATWSGPEGTTTSDGEGDRWDASGVHAWGRSTTGRRGQAEDTGRWDGTEHTGEWDRVTDPGQWDRCADTGQWERYTEVDQWDRTVPPAPVREGWASAEQAEAFWSGTQLGGEDPRRTETSSSAPHSRPLADDLLDPDPGGRIRALAYTAACYLVPALLLFVGLLFLDGRVPAECVTDITGGGCDSPRTHAFASLVAGAPRFGLALVSSLAVALVLRRIGTTWRSVTVALAAAVVGGGLSTVMISAVTGQSIG
ncbi:hypothetical protein [Micromonospora sp. SL4-19]|uniref:hypothetical protein n=1 Tax=Micromonospora sp. SL4-19 TaxID=3399129 RepID=UPI003A4D6414